MIESLCRSCGLCCDGSLFNFVPLAIEEVETHRKRLRVIASGKGFEQPCSALVDRSCAIYEERPTACRAFFCKLACEDGPLEPRIAIVRRTRELLAKRDPEDHAELDALLDRFARTTRA